MKTYPLTPVVTSSKALAEQYNDNFMSHYMLSACISSEECETLLNDGAIFEKMILINDDTQKLFPLIGKKYNWNEELMPQIIEYKLSDNDIKKSVHDIHALITGDPNKCGMG